MEGYRIYITKSKETAEFMRDMLMEQSKEKNYSVSLGYDLDLKTLPKAYRVTKMWRVTVVYKDLKRPIHEISFI